MRRFLAVIGVGVLALASLMAAGTAAQATTTDPVICPDYGDWVWDGSSWTLAGPNDLGSRKYDVNGNFSQISISAPKGYLISGYCVKAGPDRYFVTVDPPAATVVLSAPNHKDISHFSLKFVKKPHHGDAEWCSPGFWRNNADKHGASQWPVPTSTRYNDVIDNPSVPGDPTLLQVLQSPQTYGGAAFNAVATYLSLKAGLNVRFDEHGKPIGDCPLSQNG